MARDQPPDPPEEDIPSWVMTFSDVITLLMTFFILLLTFATNEPETFERMQVSLFGGGGATGVAGEISTAMDQDTVLMRERPRSGRITSRGSEMPPEFTDPAYESLAKGIAGLEEDEDRTLSTTHSLTVPLSLMVSSDGEITPFGAQQLHMIAIQMKKRPLGLDLAVGSPDSIPTAITLAERLMLHEQIALGRVGVGLASGRVGQDAVRLVVTQHRQEQSRGTQTETGRSTSQ